MWDEEVKVLWRPPVNFSQVSSFDGGFSVKRVFMKESGQERLVYLKVLVYNDGSIVEIDNYVFKEGAGGYLY